MNPLTNPFTTELSEVDFVYSNDELRENEPDEADQPSQDGMLGPEGQSNQEESAPGVAGRFDADDEPLPLQYETLEDFVNNFLCRIYERDTRGSVANWCPVWWMHDGAVFRFTALWQAWESMRLAEGPTAAAKWLTYYGDPIMTQVLSATGGPFEGCDPDKGHRLYQFHTEAALPTVKAPSGLFEPRQ